MNDPQLSDINFNQILMYGGQPDVEVNYDPPLKCNGYCIECEESNIVFDDNSYFDQMSHGCDTSDFEKVLGTLDNSNKKLSVMFLLENPGGNYGNGDIVKFKKYKKQPPINHYYWTPSEIKEWPESTDSLPNLYGPYFAYLMKKHKLGKVYITNIVKCNTVTESGTRYDKSRAVELCVNKWLKKEVAICSPEYVFCFGKNTFNYFRKYFSEYSSSGRCKYLIHPAARKSKDEIVTVNNSVISGAFA